MPSHVCLPAPGASHARVARAEVRPLSQSLTRVPVTSAAVTALRGAAARAAVQRHRSSAARADTELRIPAHWQGASGCVWFTAASIVACRSSPCSRSRVHPAAPARACLSPADRQRRPVAALPGDSTSKCNRASCTTCTWQPFAGRSQDEHRNSLRRRVSAITASAASSRTANSATEAAWTLDKQRFALPSPCRPRERVLAAPRRPLRVRAGNGAASATDGSDDSLSDEGDLEVNALRHACPLSGGNDRYPALLCRGLGLPVTQRNLPPSCLRLLRIRPRNVDGHWSPCPLCSLPCAGASRTSSAASAHVQRAHQLTVVSASQVSRELDEFDVERFRRVGAHLDLMWNVAKVRSAAEYMSDVGLISLGAASSMR